MIEESIEESIEALVRDKVQALQQEERDYQRLARQICLQKLRQQVLVTAGFALAALAAIAAGTWVQEMVHGND